MGAVGVIALASPVRARDIRTDVPFWSASGRSEALAGPAAWVRAHARRDGVLYPYSVVYLRTLGLAGGSTSLPRAEPSPLLASLRRARYPVSGVTMAIPIDGSRVDTRLLRQRLGSAMQIGAFPDWLLLHADGPLGSAGAVVCLLRRTLEAVEQGVTPSPIGTPRARPVPRRRPEGAARDGQRLLTLPRLPITHSHSNTSNPPITVTPYPVQARSLSRRTSAAHVAAGRVAAVPSLALRGSGRSSRRCLAASLCGWDAICSLPARVRRRRSASSRVAPSARHRVLAATASRGSAWVDRPTGGEPPLRARVPRRARAPRWRSRLPAAPVALARARPRAPRRTAAACASATWASAPLSTPARLPLRAARGRGPAALLARRAASTAPTASPPGASSARWPRAPRRTARSIRARRSAAAPRSRRSRASRPAGGRGVR